MRGTLAWFIDLVNMHGIIPAHAGNTSLVVPLKFTSRDHPRACGEHMIISSMQMLRTGSSPRMRGTLWIHELVDVFAGIIPAHAGNTPKIPLTSVDHRDHPRACGEHCCMSTIRYHRQGSSPRMRGTLESENH